MKVAIFESIVTPAGHEHDFDKMLVTELLQAGHQVEFFVPAGYPFKLDYGVPVNELPGAAVSYAGARGIGKLLLSAKREVRRLQWFNTLWKQAWDGRMDAIIIPTATYRFLRSLRGSKLKKSPVPVIPVMHGINKGESSRFFRQAQALAAYANIKIAVITFGTQILGQASTNVFCVKPPVFLPPDRVGSVSDSQILRLGFFGQYRREKNLTAFLTAFCQGKFTAPVQLMVQGATILPEDAADFDRICQEYADKKDITFLHKALIGADWHKAIAAVDALIMPYAAERYRYHWSAMLFTALGFQKPVVIADSINPEVLAEYGIGVAFAPDEPGRLQAALERFVNTYESRKESYKQELARANVEFAPANFVKALLKLIDNRQGEK